MVISLFSRVKYLYKEFIIKSFLHIQKMNVYIDLCVGFSGNCCMKSTGVLEKEWVIVVEFIRIIVFHVKFFL